jgi:outer membrane protein assembly factor BamB
MNSGVLDPGITVTCLDAATGETLWRTHVAPSPTPAYPQATYGRFVAGELIIVSQAGARDADFVEVLDATTGRSLRRFDW